ncbi:SMODS-associated and fused to various effectors domain-containing protein [Candidatus Magnetomoraceae bacterium gMMP-15]
MIIYINDFITNVLSPINIVIGLLIAVPIFWTWWEVIFGRRRREKKWMKEICSNPGNRPVLLVVNLKPDIDILPQVQNSRLQDPDLKTITDDRIFHIRRDNWLKPEDMPKFVEDFREKLGEIVKSGADAVYFVYAGPVTPASIIGAELANCCRVILLQHQQGKYIKWGPLKHGLM